MVVSGHNRYSQGSTLENKIYQKQNFQMNSNYNREFMPMTDPKIIELKMTAITHEQDYEPTTVMISKEELEYVQKFKFSRQRPRSSILTPFQIAFQKP